MIKMNQTLGLLILPTLALGAGGCFGNTDPQIWGYQFCAKIENDSTHPASSTRTGVNFFTRAYYDASKSTDDGVNLSTNILGVELNDGAFCSEPAILGAPLPQTFYMNKRPDSITWMTTEEGYCAIAKKRKISVTQASEKLTDNAPSGANSPDTYNGGGAEDFRHGVLVEEVTFDLKPVPCASFPEEQVQMETWPKSALAMPEVSALTRNGDPARDAEIGKPGELPVSTTTPDAPFIVCTQGKQQPGCDVFLTLGNYPYVLRTPLTGPINPQTYVAVFGADDFVNINSTAEPSLKTIDWGTPLSPNWCNGHTASSSPKSTHISPKTNNYGGSNDPFCEARHSEYPEVLPAVAELEGFAAGQTISLAATAQSPGVQIKIVGVFGVDIQTAQALVLWNSSTKRVIAMPVKEILDRKIDPTQIKPVLDSLQTSGCIGSVCTCVGPICTQNNVLIFEKPNNAPATALDAGVTNEDADAGIDTDASISMATSLQEIPFVIATAESIDSDGKLTLSPKLWRNKATVYGAKSEVWKWLDWGKTTWEDFPKPTSNYPREASYAYVSTPCISEVCEGAEFKTESGMIYVHSLFGNAERGYAFTTVRVRNGDAVFTLLSFSDLAAAIQ